MKYIYNVLIGLVLFGLITMLVLLIITPEKTNSGSYTNVIKYWTSDKYFESNFASERTK